MLPGIKIRTAVILIAAGSALIAASVSLFAYNRWDEERANDKAAETARLFISAVRAADSQIGGAGPPTGNSAADPESGKDRPLGQTIVIDNYNYIGVLSIPSLGLSLPVMDSWSYPRLKLSPCRYFDTIGGNNLVIAAHNYNRHFGHIDKLAYADPVIITDTAGGVHNYRVAEVTAVDAGDMIGMIDSGYALTLFTCTYGGQARVTVRCVKNEAEDRRESVSYIYVSIGNVL